MNNTTPRQSAKGLMAQIEQSNKIVNYTWNLKTLEELEKALNAAQCNMLKGRMTGKTYSNMWKTGTSAPVDPVEEKPVVKIKTRAEILAEIQILAEYEQAS